MRICAGVKGDLNLALLTASDKLRSVAGRAAFMMLTSGPETFDLDQDEAPVPQQRGGQLLRLFGDQPRMFVRLLDDHCGCSERTTWLGDGCVVATVQLEAKHGGSDVRRRSLVHEADTTTEAIGGEQ